ncbi:MAG: M48 family metalloprotease [Myxococcota bacterium]
MNTIDNTRRKHAGERWGVRLGVALSLFLGVTFGQGIAHAQLGKKLLRKGNLDAATKMGKAMTLSDKQVAALARDSVAWQDANNPVATTGDAYGARLVRLVTGLEREDGLDLNFKVYLVAEYNAFAAPDGSIRVMAGLMDLLTDGELRAVIGHEIGHVKLKHSKKQYQKAYTVSAGRDAAVANSGQLGAIPQGSMGGFVEQVLNAKFSRNDESEADAYGFKFLLKHDYDYHAMETAFLKISVIAGDKAASSLKSSHPDPGDRSVKAKKWADAEDARRPSAPPTNAEPSGAEGSDADADGSPDPAPTPEAPSGDPSSAALP